MCFFSHWRGRFLPDLPGSAPKAVGVSITLASVVRLAQRVRRLNSNLRYCPSALRFQRRLQPLGGPLQVAYFR